MWDLREPVRSLARAPVALGQGSPALSGCICASQDVIHPEWTWSWESSPCPQPLCLGLCPALHRPQPRLFVFVHCGGEAQIACGGEGWKLNPYNCHPPLSQQAVITGAVVTPESSKAAGVFTSRSCGALGKAPPELHPFHSREEGSREGGRNLPGNVSRPCHTLPEAEQTAGEGRGFPQRAENQWSCAHPPHGAARMGGSAAGSTLVQGLIICWSLLVSPHY